MRVRKVCSLITILFKPILCPCPRNISRIQPPGRQKRGSENPSRARELYQCNVSVPLSNLEAAASPLSNSADKRCPASRKPPFRQPFPKPMPLSWSWNRGNRFRATRCEWGTDARILRVTFARKLISKWKYFSKAETRCAFILENSKR